MIRPVLALIAGAALLGGCDLAPKHVRPAGAIPLTVPQGGAYPPAVTDAPDVTAIGWRDFFVEDKLRRVIALGLDNNRDLRTAAANVLQARAQYRIQRADRLPTVTGSASATYTNNVLGATSSASSVATTGTTTTTGGTSVGTGNVGTGSAALAGTSSGTITSYSVDVGVAAFEIDLFGRVRNLSRAALEQYLASEEGQRSTRIGLISEIATAYLTMAADQDKLKIARDTLESFRQSLELTRAQFRVGVSSELEVRQADTNYQDARNDIATLTSSVAQDQNALDLLVGTTVPLELLPGGLGEIDYTLSQLPPDISSKVLLQRPDVLQAEHQLIAQEANIGAARAAMFPTISLTATLGTISGGLSGLFGHGSETWTVAPSASVPIFDFGRRIGNVRYAEASRQAALSTYEKTLQTAFREVADALATRGTIDEQVAARAARANSANVAARLSDARYRAGVDSFLTTLDSQRTAYAARQDLVTTRLARANNLVQIYSGLGGGLR